MINILMHGCNGHMGQVITRMAAENENTQIAAGVDPFAGADCGYPVYSSIRDFQERGRERVDVIIDFSSAKAVDDLVEYCVKTHTPCVLCTTGLSEEQLAAVHAGAGQTAFLKSANMSLGINLLMKVLKEAAGVLAGAGFDVEIVEKHHNRKLDAPSGTALALADSVNEGTEGAYHYVYDRSGRREKRDPKEIGISAVRGPRRHHCGGSRCDLCWGGRGSDLFPYCLFQKYFCKRRASGGTFPGRQRGGHVRHERCDRDGEGIKIIVHGSLKYLLPER